MSIRLRLQHLLPQRILSWLAAKVANCSVAFFKNFLINQYCSYYQIDLTDAIESDYRRYKTFNDFFTRALRPGAREISQDPRGINSPVDGAVWQCGTLDAQSSIYAKGRGFTLQELLADSVQAERFQNGTYAVLYLAPFNYHRVHMPIPGRLKMMRYIPGTLFSVNPQIADEFPQIFARNERVVLNFDTEAGEMVMVLVGAMIVGSIETSWAGTIAPQTLRNLISWEYREDPSKIFAPGAEIGRFKLGSTVILLFPSQQVSWSPLLRSGQSIKMGEQLGTLVGNQNLQQSDISAQPTPR